MPRPHIPDFYSRPWYDHCRLKFVKCNIRIVWFGIFFIVNETLKQNLQSCESLNDLKCVNGTINPIQFKFVWFGLKNLQICFFVCTRQQSDTVPEASRFSRFQPTSSRLSRSRSDYDPSCIFRMVKNNRLCPDSVPISSDVWTRH